jgi:hypothetical protein
MLNAGVHITKVGKVVGWSGVPVPDDFAFGQSPQLIERIGSSGGLEPTTLRLTGGRRPLDVFYFQLFTRSRTAFLEPIRR